MIKNYIKLTFKLLLRNKYYTTLTLLGISFTIMIIIIFASFIDQIVAPNAPEVNKNRTLILNNITLYKKGKGTNSTPSIYFLQKYVAGMESTKAISFVSLKSFFYGINNKTTGHMLRYCDESFWKIVDFKFISGKPFSIKDVKNSLRVAVISDKMKNQVFDNQDAIGKSMTIYGQKFLVIGVVKSANAFGNVYADIYLPYTTDETLKTTEKPIEGNYNAMLLANSDDLGKVRKELINRLNKIRYNLSGADSIKASAFTALETFSKTSPSDEEPEYGKITIVILLAMTLFMLIPAISLINLNLSRVGERAQEIGIRKSFGATSGALVSQLIIENVIITLIGGFIGLGLAIYFSQLLIDIINTFDPLYKIPVDSFNISWRVLGFCILSCLFFGLLSGVYPAWKMSRLNVIYALNGGESL